MDINHKVSTSYWVLNGNSKPSTTLLKRVLQYSYNRYWFIYKVRRINMQKELPILATLFVVLLGLEPRTP